jgi:hypothetical protein
VVLIVVGQLDVSNVLVGSIVAVVGSVGKQIRASAPLPLPPKQVAGSTPSTAASPALASEAHAPGPRHTWFAPHDIPDGHSPAGPQRTVQFSTSAG